MTGQVIRITQQDIDDGKQYKDRSCAIAVNLKRDRIVPLQISVNHNNSGGIKIGKEHFAMPSRVENWIDDFDVDKSSVKPITFKLGKRLTFNRTTKEWE